MSMRIIILLLAAMSVHTGAHAQSGPSAINFSGVLNKADGTPEISASVDFRLEVWDKFGTCRLYSELHENQDLSVTKGGFYLKLGAGTSQNNYLNNTAVYAGNIFANPGVVAPFPGCAGVTLAAGDERMLRVNFDLGGGYIAFSPDFPITAVPYAIVAENLQGKTPVDLIQVKDDVATDLSQANVENVFSSTNYATLVSLLAGNYMPTTPAAPVNFNNQRLISIADPTAAQDAATKNYSDTKVAGKIIDLQDVGAGTGGGKVLTWDQAQNKWVAIAPTAVDNTKLPLAGGTMSGNLYMGSYVIGNAGGIGVGVSTPLAGTIADFNGTGTALSSIIIPRDSTGNRPTAPADGMLRYNTTTFKFEGYENGAWANLGGGGITALTGDIGASGSGSVAATIQDNAVRSVHLKNTGVAVNRLVITDATTGAGLGYMTCNLNEILEWTATGWACVMRGKWNTLGADTYYTGGNVGIGNSSPTTRLDVTGPIFSREWGTNPGETGMIKFRELGANGAMYVGFRAPDNVTTSVIWSLPALDGSPNQVLKTDGTGVLSWGTPATMPGGSHQQVQFNSGGVLAGTPTFAWDTTNGRLGVGNASPTAKLHVEGSSPGTQVLLVKGTGGQTAELLSIQDNSGVEKFSVTVNGSWTNQLQVDQGTPSAPAITRTTDTNTGMLFPALDNLALSTNGIERFRIDSAGNVGIGTSTPAAPLHIANQSTPTIIHDGVGVSGPVFKIRQSNGSLSSPSSTNLNDQLGTISFSGYGATFASPAARIIAAATENFTGSQGGAYLAFGTRPNATAGSPQERMRITSDGNVGIGHAAPSDLLTVASVSPTIALQDMDTVAASAPTAMLAFKDSSNAVMGLVGYTGLTPGLNIRMEMAHPIQFSNQSTELMRITPAGWVGIGNASPAAPLHVNGSIVGGEFASGTTANFNAGNSAVISNMGGGTVITLQNMVAGGHYQVIVTDPVSATYTFSGCAGNTYWTATNSATTATKPTIYAIYHSAGGHCFIERKVFAY